MRRRAGQRAFAYSRMSNASAVGVANWPDAFLAARGFPSSKAAWSAKRRSSRLSPDASGVTVETAEGRRADAPQPSRCPQLPHSQGSIEVAAKQEHELHTLAIGATQLRELRGLLFAAFVDVCIVACRLRLEK